MPLSTERTTDAATDNRHPLNDFWGDLADINDYSKLRISDTSKFNTFIKFDFASIDVIASKEPYNFPVTSVEILELNMPNSPWEAFKASLRNCGFIGDLNGLIGKRLRMQYTDAILSQRKPNPEAAGKFIYSNEPGSCWQVVEIEGVENTSNRLLDATVALANGVNDSTFKTVFMSDNSIRTMTGYAEMLVSVANNQALDMLVNSGKLTKGVDGLYSKVA